MCRPITQVSAGGGDEFACLQYLSLTERQMQIGREGCSRESVCSGGDVLAKPMIGFDDVSVRFGSVTAIGSYTDVVRSNEFVSLVGPSGCGKSTVLRLASGLIEPTTGTVTPGTDKVGYVFQDATLMPWRTVRGNVELLGELDKMDRAERKQRTDEALALVGLTEFEDYYPLALSGGMKMRASLARSLLLEPDLFLFDEPFGALDQISRARLNEDLLALYVEKKFASIFVTHSVQEAVFLGTRVVVMCARPGTIVHEFAVPFDYPRDPSLRYDQEFTTIAGNIAEALQEAS
jgi:NitT/TauT family transport system ATP-binding protein